MPFSGQGFGVSAALSLADLTRHCFRSAMLNTAHILCLVPPAPSALRQGLHLARRVGAALHVMPTPLPRGPSGSATGRDEIHSLVERLVPDASEDPPLEITEAPPGSPSEVLQYVADANIDLVVTAPPPDQESAPPLATDVSRVLTEQLACPLFIVEPGTDPATVQDILVPTDLSDHALRAFKHAVALARLYDATVHVLHVVESLPYVALTPTDRLSLGPTPLSEHRGRRRLRAFLRRGQVSEVPVQSHLVYGDPADQIGRFADENAVDLLVLSSHGAGSRPHRALGRVAKSVLGEVAGSLFLFHATGSSLLSASSQSSPDDASPS